MEDILDDVNICSEIWNDLDILDETNSSQCSISFITPIASGFRFRYQSEIDKKSYSLLKGENNKSPEIMIITSADNAYVKIELVIEKEDKQHFNMLYEVPKDKTKTTILDGICFISLPSAGKKIIKLDSYGIRKMKAKEAISRLKMLYTNISESQAKDFFSKRKEVVRLKFTIIQYDLPAAYMFSEPIKSQTSKENKLVKIKHFSPKVVAENGEQLIVVLEKKITTEDFIARIEITNNPNYQKMIPIEQDGQTFIFNIPKIICENATDGKFTMSCGEYSDSKPIKFLPIQTEPRKRKNYEPTIQCNIPLKKSTKYENTEYVQEQQLYPESGKHERLQFDGPRMENMTTHIQFNDCRSSNDSSNHYEDRNSFEEIECDGSRPMDISNEMGNIISQYIRSDNESCKDSGIHSGERTSSDDDMESSDDSSDEFIETEGFKRKTGTSSQHIEAINVPPKRRSNDSKFDNISNNATKKILSEVARIGHDFAFGKTSNDLFERVEKQLPVVFTLQDDVGDTPLNNAILKGNVEHAFKILQIVQMNCPWALDLVNTSGHSALILAPACDVPPELIKKLLFAGCPLDLWDDTGKSAIIYAIEYKNVKALEVLLEHARQRTMKRVLSRFESSYYTPLQIAIMNSFTKGVQMLLELKDFNGNYLVDVNEIGLMNEETALHIAVSHECDNEMLQTLLKRPDIKINQPLSNKTTALHVAKKMKLLDLIEILVNNNAVDLPNASEVDIEESEDNDDDIEDMDTIFCDANQYIEETNPIIEEMSTHETLQNNIITLTASVNALSLKGPLKKSLVEILIVSGEPSLTIADLRNIVKPTFIHMLKNYGNTSEHKRDICELLDRINCLPNSVGQLIQNLQKVGRSDLIKKIEQHLDSKF